MINNTIFITLFIVLCLIQFHSNVSGRLIAEELSTIPSPSPLVRQYLDEFELHGLFGATYQSFIMGTVGDHASDNAMHGGGYGSVISGIGPSEYNKLADNLLGLNTIQNNGGALYNPISRSFQASLLGSNDVNLGTMQPAPVVTAASPAGVRGVGGVRIGGIGGYAGGSGPGVSYGGDGGSGRKSVGSQVTPIVTQTKSVASQVTPILSSAEQRKQARGGIGSRYAGGIEGIIGDYLSNTGSGGKKSHPILPDPYQGVTANLGMGGVPVYATANQLVGSPVTGKRYASPFGTGLDAVSATTISSRINGIPQAVAGGREVGRFGDGIFGLGDAQLISAWAEAPDFTKLI